MKEESKYLLDYVRANVSPKLKHIPKLKFSLESTTMLKRIIAQVRVAESQYDPIAFKTIKLNPDYFPTGRDYLFCPEAIRAEIENMDKKGIIYSFAIQHRYFNIIIAYSSLKQNINKFLKDAIKKIYIWLYVACLNANPECPQQVDIYINMTGLKKYLPAKKSAIDKIHANSGYTTGCKPKSEIHIFREEEWFKVLIHESFHCFALDFSTLNQASINQYIMGLFHVDMDARLYETYCETWAETINVLTHMTISNKQTEEAIIKKMANILRMEQEFSIFQCAKVLQHYGLTYHDLIRNKKTERFVAGTSVLSYYVIKSICLFFIDDFITWCSQHNGSLNFQKRLATVKDYGLFIGNHYKEKTYIEAIDSVTLETPVKNSVEHVSLRMTIFEI